MVLASFLLTPLWGGVAVVIDLIHLFQPASTGFSFSAESGEAKTEFASLPCKQGSRHDSGAAEDLQPGETWIWNGIKRTERHSREHLFISLFICPCRSNRCGGTTSGVLSLQAEVPGLCSLLIPGLSAGCRRGSSPGGLVLWVIPGSLICLLLLRPFWRFCKHINLILNLFLLTITRLVPTAARGCWKRWEHSHPFHRWDLERWTAIQGLEVVRASSGVWTQVWPQWRRSRTV